MNASRQIARTHQAARTADLRVVVQNPATTVRFTVVVDRPGQDPVAIGSFSRPEFAGLAARVLVERLADPNTYLYVTEADGNTPVLPDLPTDPQLLADHLTEDLGIDVHTRLAVQVGAKTARRLLAAAYTAAADQLRTAA